MLGVQETNSTGSNLAILVTQPRQSSLTFVAELKLKFAEVGARIAYKSTDSVRCSEIARIRKIIYTKCTSPAVSLYVGYDIRRRVRRNRVRIQQVGKHAASVGESAGQCKSLLPASQQIVAGPQIGDTIRSCSRSGRSQ